MTPLDHQHEPAISGARAVALLIGLLALYGGAIWGVLR